MIFRPTQEITCANSWHRIFCCVINPRKNFVAHRSSIQELAGLVNSLPSLEKLVLIMPNQKSSICAQSFEAANVVLPRVTSLVVGLHCEFLVGMCPNVRVIMAKDAAYRNSCLKNWGSDNAVTRFTNAIRPVTQVIHLEMTAHWTGQLLKGEFCLLSSAVFISLMP